MEGNVKIVAFGEPLVGIYPPKGQSLAKDSPLSLTWGGDTSNFVLAISKLGHQGGYLSKVGDDVFGHEFLKLWQQSKVDTRGVLQAKDNPTGVYFISYAGEEHEFVYHRKGSAVSTMLPNEINWDCLKGAKVLHLSGISQGIGINGIETSFALLRYAKENGILVSYDVNYRPLLWPKDVARAIISYTVAEFVDILELTEEEMEFMGWGQVPEQIDEYLPRVPKIVAVKRGKKGCCLISDGKSVRIPAYKMDTVDTVGAGDAFDAGLVVGVLESLPLTELGRFANAVGALTCRGAGPLQRQPTRKEVENLVLGGETYDKK